MQQRHFGWRHMMAMCESCWCLDAVYYVVTASAACYKNINHPQNVISSSSDPSSSLDCQPATQSAVPAGMALALQDPREGPLLLLNPT